jgi:hypothetical protein
MCTAALYARTAVSYRMSNFPRRVWERMSIWIDFDFYMGKPRFPIPFGQDERICKTALDSANKAAIHLQARARDVRGSIGK